MGGTGAGAVAAAGAAAVPAGAGLSAKPEVEAAAKAATPRKLNVRFLNMADSLVLYIVGKTDRALKAPPRQGGNFTPIPGVQPMRPDSGLD
jgi:hypothetical protein